MEVRKEGDTQILEVNPSMPEQSGQITITLGSY